MSADASLSVRIERHRLVSRMRAIKQEIDQIFIDADHWNEFARKPNEAKIDPDPDGQLRRLQKAYGAALAVEEKRSRR